MGVKFNCFTTINYILYGGRKTVKYKRCNSTSYQCILW